MKITTLSITILSLFALSTAAFCQTVETKLAGTHYYDSGNVTKVETQYAGTAYFNYSKPGFTVPSYGNLYERANLADKLGHHNSNEYNKIKADINSVLPTIKDEDLKNEFKILLTELESLPKQFKYSEMTNYLERISTELRHLYEVKNSEDYIAYVQNQFAQKNYKIVIDNLNELQIEGEWIDWKLKYLLHSYLKLGDYISAMNEANKLSTNLDRDFSKSLIKIEMKDYYGALAIYDDMLIQNTFNSEITLDLILNNKAYALLKLRKLTDAMLTINKALEINPSNSLALDTKGEILFTVGKYAESITFMNRAINIDEHENSFYIRGLANIKLRKIESGCKDLSKSFELGKTESIDQIKKYCQ